MTTETTTPKKPAFDRKRYQRERYHLLKAKKAPASTPAPVAYAGETPAEQVFNRIAAEAPVVPLSERA